MRHRRIRKVIVVNTADQGGGTERIAWLLFKGFEKRGIDSWMVVGQKRSDDPHVIPIYASPHLDYRSYETLWHRRIVPALRALDERVGLEQYRYPFSKRLGDITGSPPDIVLACNLHGGYFDLRALAALSRKIPVVVRPGDGWLATGHCAIPDTCERWRTGCGKCPDLTRPPAVRSDLTRINWLRKRRIYRSARWSVIAPSVWQMQRLDQSVLRHAVGPRHVVRNGVERSIFCPGPRDEARRQLGLAPDRVIALVVASLGVNTPSKDFQTLRAALARAALKPASVPIEVLVIGRAGPSEYFGEIVMHHRSYCRSPDELACHYRSADFVINPTCEETFSNVTAEAMSCGIPVIASRVGALPEIIEHEKTGLLVAPADAEALANAIERLAGAADMRRSLSLEATAYAEREFAVERMIERYLEIFDEAIAQREHPTAAAGRPALRA